MLLSALHQQALGTLEVPVLSTAYVGPVPHFVRNETALRQAGTQPCTFSWEESSTSFFTTRPPTQPDHALQQEWVSGGKLVSQSFRRVGKG